MGSSCSQGKKPYKLSKIPKTQPQITYSQANKSEDQDVLVFSNQKSAIKFFNSQNEELTKRDSQAKQSQDLLSIDCKQEIRPCSLSGISPQSTAHPQTPQKTSLKIIPKTSRLEQFIIERKQYMIQKGVSQYTPYTILPAPRLKKVQNNQLFKRRNPLNNSHNLLVKNQSPLSSGKHNRKFFSSESISHFSSNNNEIMRELQSGKLKEGPTKALKGDEDQIEIDL